MLISASAEVFQLAYPALDRARRLTIPYLNSAFKLSNLADLAIEIRYVPIVMPEGMRERYPARSRLRLKDHVFESAPQLNYEVFVSGSSSMQIEEYLSGIAAAARQLVRLGANGQHIEVFQEILRIAGEI